MDFRLYPFRKKDSKWNYLDLHECLAGKGMNGTKPYKSSFHTNPYIHTKDHMDISKSNIAQGPEWGTSPRHQPQAPIYERYQNYLSHPMDSSPWQQEQTVLTVYGHHTAAVRPTAGAGRTCFSGSKSQGLFFSIPNIGKTPEHLPLALKSPVLCPLHLASVL